MRFKIKLFGKKLILDYGLKEPELVTSKEVLQYANKDQISKELRRVNKLLTIMSKRHNLTEVYAKNLSQIDIDILTRRGFIVSVRTRTVKGKEVAMYKHWKISA
jgi:hypothetical protein